MHEEAHVATLTSVIAYISQEKGGCDGRPVPTFNGDGTVGDAVSRFNVFEVHGFAVVDVRLRLLQWMRWHLRGHMRAGKIEIIVI